MEHYQLLEKKFAEWNSLPPEGMVACSSGTAALHLAFEAMRLPLGSQVITSDLTMVACPRAISLAGLCPVFVDCLDNLTVDCGHVQRRLTRDVSAILAVHIYGRRCYMEALANTAKRNPYGPIALVEDLAEAHGVRVYEETDAACWSFYRNKIVRGEEGGAVWFRNPEHARIARQLRSLGFTEEHDFTHIPRGHNYRMSNLHAYPILDSLQCADQNISKRKQVEDWYNEKIPKQYQSEFARNRVWVYDLRIPGMDKPQQDKLVKGLRAVGVQARHCFKPMTSLEEWRAASNPKSTILANEIIYLPVDSYMTEWDVEQIVEKFCRLV